MAILKVEKELSLFQCGGTLIDSRHVLTVAHCVEPYLDTSKYNLKIRMGEWDTQQINEFLPHEDYELEQIILHPQYNKKNFWNDLAILRLDRKVEFRPNIDTICLPRPEERFEGQECVTTGWGKTDYRKFNGLSKWPQCIWNSLSCCMIDTILGHTIGFTWKNRFIFTSIQ